jgi:hypothetical protein
MATGIPAAGVSPDIPAVQRFNCDGNYGQEMYAEALLVYGEHILTNEDPGTAYEKLLVGHVIERTGKTATRSTSARYAGC